MQKLKFGVIGCSKIAESSVIPAIIQSNYSELKIIGSRSKQKAESFAKKFHCSDFGSYQDVLNSDVDVVYISLPVSMHEEWSIKAANAGKHVLCEKSSTTSYLSACKMVNACKENNVRIMEGFMFRFHPQHQKVLDILNSVPTDMNATMTLSTSKIEEFSVDPHNHFLLMIDSFCMQVSGNSISNFNFEEDLINQAKIMDAARISHKENRSVHISEIN